MSNVNTKDKTGNCQPLNHLLESGLYIHTLYLMKYYFLFLRLVIQLAAVPIVPKLSVSPFFLKVSHIKVTMRSG